MPTNTLFAVAAGIVMLSFACFIAIRKNKPLQQGWMFPALISILFFGFSIHAVISEGPLGFWTEHVRSFWGNQIWFDLLIAASIGWYFIVPKAKEHNMNILIWMILVVSSGCIGLTAMLARLLYLRENSQSATR